ncbi:hypothetical protein H4S01_001153 [Coemansia sp. RSA 2610]|nr:hypothetical protein H4S01_001153 [Coemansia sp. RSA 2610]
MAKATHSRDKGNSKRQKLANESDSAFAASDVDLPSPPLSDTSSVIVEVEERRPRAGASVDPATSNLPARDQRTALPPDLQLQGQSTQLAAPLPSRVHGAKANVQGDFEKVARRNGLFVDKSLLCKALYEAEGTPICVCFPRRFGKTFNLSVIEEFFNVVSNTDIAPEDGVVDHAAGRNSRLKLFERSVLHDDHREFFDEHFCKYPVIRITLKDNRNLEAGLLAGVQHVDLCDSFSGVNNIYMLPLAVAEGSAAPVIASDQIGDFGNLFAFSRADVAALVDAVKQQHPHLEKFSAESIMGKLTEWYDGYHFSSGAGKFNPHAVTMFIRALCLPQLSPTLEKAADYYWEQTSEKQLIRSITLANRASILQLAPVLLAAYHAQHAGVVKLADVWRAVPTSDSVVSENPDAIIRVGLTRDCVADDGLEKDMDELVSLFVYSGYLTIRPGGHIAIPNREMCDVWQKMQAMSSSAE